MKKFAKAAALSMACTTVILSSQNLYAVDVNAAASGDWSAAGTWNPNEPTAADNGLINGGFTVGVSQLGEVANRVDLGTASGQTGNLSITGGTLNVGSATGTDPSLRLGTVLGGTGNLSMTGGIVNIVGAINGDLSNGDLQVGRDGAGTMTMSGGQVNVSDEIPIGTGPGSVGVLSISGGMVTNGTLFGTGSGTGRSCLAGFGLNTQGTINMSGTGNLTVRFDVVLGLFDNAKGFLNVADQSVVSTNFIFASANAATTSTTNQTGGTINAREGFVVGQRGTSTWNQSGGVFNGRFISAADDGTGTYNLSGTGVANLTGELIMAVFPNGNGTVNQTGGTVNATNATSGNMVAGRDGVGVYNQSAGLLNVTNVFLGDFDTSSGTHNITGGVVTVAGNYNVGAALASNAPADAGRTGTQGQATGAVGKLIVHGNGAVITIGGKFLANPADNTRGGNGATLVFEIGSNAGTSLVSVVGAGDLDGSVVDMNLFGGFTPTVGQTFNLIAAGGGFGATGTGTTQNTGTGEGYTQAAGDSAFWQLSVVPGQVAGSEILRATFVPEPTSLAALAGVASMVLRRRRA